MQAAMVLGRILVQAVKGLRWQKNITHQKKVLLFWMNQVWSIQEL